MTLQFLIIGRVQIIKNFGGKQTFVIFAGIGIHGSFITDWKSALRD